MEVETLIKTSLQELQKIGWENEIKTQESKLIFPTQESKLIFPKYCVGNHKGKKRISEQEARFLFVRELEKQDNFYYSVETPTKEPYTDFSSESPVVGTGRSGCVDVTLYEITGEKYCRKHLIEFKLGNVDTCKKDFLKLLCDDNECKTNYYINIIKNNDKTTKKRLENTLKDLETEKYNPAIKYVFDNYEIKSNLKIFVCILNDIKITENNIIEYQIDNENQRIKEITERIK